MGENPLQRIPFESGRLFISNLNEVAFFLNSPSQVTKSGNCILTGLITLFSASHWCTIREKKKRRIANASFSGTKCTKDINIIAQNAVYTNNRKSTACQLYGLVHSKVVTFDVEDSSFSNFSLVHSKVGTFYGTILNHVHCTRLLSTVKL